jgi:hypothetical protein
VSAGGTRASCHPLSQLFLPAADVKASEIAIPGLDDKQESGTDAVKQVSLDDDSDVPVQVGKKACARALL